MYCSKCGSKLKENDIFCQNCGNKINELNKKEEQINNSVKWKNEKAKEKKRRKGLIIAICCVLAIIGCLVYNLTAGTATNKGDLDIEYEEMEKYIYELNLSNSNKYQEYLADINRIYYANHKAVNPASTSNVKNIKIEFIEKYNNMYIYKFKTSKAIEGFYYVPYAHSPNTTYSNVKPFVGKNTIFQENVDYYYAKKSDNTYFQSNIEENKKIFNDIQLLKQEINKVSDVEKHEKGNSLISLIFSLVFSAFKKL